MEATGFALAIIAEARTIATSITTRIANIRDGPETNRILTEKLDRLTGQLARVEELMRTKPGTIPDEVAADVKDTLQSVRDTLRRSNSTVEKVCSKAFPGAASGSRAMAESVMRQTFRANAISNAMNGLQAHLQEASSHLLTLITALATGLTIHDVVIPKLDSLQIAGNVEVYRAAASTPALPVGTHLNFDARDAEGNHCTPDAMLKASILAAGSVSQVTAAAGTITYAHGVVGRAGVGKTIALQALAFDEDIQTRFPDGIHYLALGQGASLSTAVDALAKIMRMTGASASISAVKSSSLLQDAVDYAVAWFNGKVCLFLVDDLWRTANCETGYLEDLRQILRSCPQSRMAITTRNTLIADAAGHTVDFAPRAPLGPVSLNIFLMHATRDAGRNAPQEAMGDLRRSIATILTICAGLPIALVVCGSTVAFLARERGNFEGACDAYAVQLQRKRTELGEEQGPGGSSLNSGIVLSLTILEDEFVKLKSRNAVDLEATIADLYTSLCVLRYQGRVPVSVLSRMWKVEEDFALGVSRLLNMMSLCKLLFQDRAENIAKKGSLMLHDLQLDFCKRQADEKETSSLWHARILNGYSEQLASTYKSSLSGEQGDSFDHMRLVRTPRSCFPRLARIFCGYMKQLRRSFKGDSFERALLAYTPRSWWSVPEDEYIHENLARNLVGANLGTELAALLLDARWTHVRFDIGGILSLKSDFECLVTLGEDVFPLGVSREYELLWKGIQVSWGRASEGKGSLLFQVCGRMFILRTNSAVVRSYLESVEAHTPLPYLVPVTPFFPDSRSAQIMEIPVGGGCGAVDCSPCGRFIAAGAGNDVVVADPSTGDIVKRLKGHSGRVTCVTFAAGSKRIVSSSVDKSVVVWERETSESSAHVLEGHSDDVSGIAVCSDGSKIFSCSNDRTLKIWDANAGTHIEEFGQKRDVYCVAVSTDDQYIAIGLHDGTQVMNSSTGRTVLEDSDAHTWSIVSVAFSASDKLLATGSWDYKIRVWNTTTWACVGGPFKGHTSWVRCVMFSPVGQLLASGSSDHTVRLWDVNTGTNIWTSSDTYSEVRTVSFAPNGESIISGSEDGNIRIWDTRVEAEANEREYGHSARVVAIAISHDGLRVASVSEDRTVRLWDSRTGSQIGRPMEGRTYLVRCVSFSCDGRYLVSGSNDKTVRLWDAETANQIGAPLEGHSGVVWYVSFSSDDRRILSGSLDKTVRIWDAKSGVLIGNALLGHTAFVLAVSESGDGSYVVSRDEYGAVIIWNRVNRTIVFQSTHVSDSEVEAPMTHDSGARREMTPEEAETIIRSCGQETPHLWPTSFPPYTAELYCGGSTVYSNVPIENTILGTLPSFVRSWKYNDTKRLFVAGLESGAVAICNLKV